MLSVGQFFCIHKSFLVIYMETQSQKNPLAV